MTNTTGAKAPATLDALAYVPSSRDWRFEVYIDFPLGAYSVQERHVSENGYSFYERDGHAVSYTLPDNADASRFADFMAEEVGPLLSRIQAGYTTRWNGSNEVAVFTADARDAQDELGETLSFGCDTLIPVLGEGAGQWEAADWLGASRVTLQQEYGITAMTTDSEIAGIAETIDADALTGKVVLSGTARFLRYLRDDLEAGARSEAE